MHTSYYKYLPLLFFLLLVGFVVYKNTSPLRGGPQITILFPEPFSKVAPAIRVHGTTPHAKKVTVNGVSVYVTQEGAWERRVLLSSPLDTITIEAEDFLLRTNKKTISVSVAGF